MKIIERFVMSFKKGAIKLLKFLLFLEGEHLILAMFHIVSVAVHQWRKKHSPSLKPTTAKRTSSQSKQHALRMCTSWIKTQGILWILSNGWLTETRVC